MDQAESLRSLFANPSAKERLIQCRDRVREAIRVGNHADIQLLMLELEQAQANFEEECIDNSKIETT
ncbi:hypothetical protein PTW35_22740 (plasmid) [Photobacterium sp. DA100]|uniref:hypothetical protein n=1 Tax=Photobacterium sp. DA100 TaxID=3027472 RepID=UPI002478CA81|nr:hypothetical protein [Photobacterium sp. DA100]WEM44109.1 hypothetical protein PTW35_22740 [Photobacterium sp. DA100]